VVDNELNMEARRDHNLISSNNPAFAGNEENQNKKKLSLVYRPNFNSGCPEYIAKMLNHLTATFGHPPFLSAFPRRPRQKLGCEFLRPVLRLTCAIFLVL
jgi:hypothetical protein